MSHADTSTASIETPFQPVTFERRPAYIGGYWFGGIGLLVFAAICFVAAMFGRPGAFALHSVTTLPTMIGIGLIIQARRLRKTPESLTIDSTGITVGTDGSTQLFNWEQIAWNEETTQPLSNRKQAIIYGLNSKPLLKLADAFYDFDRFVVLLNRRVKSQPHRAADQVRLKRMRRRAWLLLTLGIVFPALCGFLFLTGCEEARAASRLKSAGTFGTATVVRKFTAPNGLNKRLEYRVDAKRPDGGEPELMNVEIDPRIWPAFQEHGQIAVRFVPDEPDISTPLVGYIKDDFGAHIPPWLLMIGGIVAAMLFLGGAVTSFLGIDLLVDSETKKLRIARSAAAPILPGPVP